MISLLLDLTRYLTIVVQFLEFEQEERPERRTAHLAEQGRALLGRLKAEVG